jgi:FliI/YscN family ATPase
VSAGARTIDLEHAVRAANAAPVVRVCGRVRRLVGQLVEIDGVETAVGGELVAACGAGTVRLEVLGFRESRLLAAPLGATAGIVPGARVWTARDGARVPAGDALLGRIVDAFGNPLDGGPPPACTHEQPVRGAPPSPFSRAPIDRAFPTGVRVIDALLPLGRGQRVGLFAGAGVGKSTLLGMMCRRAAADVVVVGLIGERGREVGDFVRQSLGKEGLKRSVVVAATSDAPSLVRVRGALAAQAIAEYFRARGLDVLLVMDSVTRFAMALREATLAAGEPPLTKGYTPSVFAALPALLERAGCGRPGEGTITAFYTVLVEGDDMTDPVADALKSILDGHVVLSRALADRAMFPAVDVLRSVSRVASEVAPPSRLAAAGRVRDLLAAHEEAADLLRIGAYVAGSDPRVDAARAAMPRIEQLVRQGADEHVTPEDAQAALAAVLEGIAP